MEVGEALTKVDRLVLHGQRREFGKHAKSEAARALG